MKTKVSYQIGDFSHFLYRVNIKGQHWFWSEFFNKWHRSITDTPCLTPNISAKQARKMYPEAFKVKLP